MAEKPKSPNWYRDSRFYLLGASALYMSASFVYISMWLHPDLVNAAFGVFGGTTAMLLGGGTWINSKERDNTMARIENGTEGDAEGAGD